MWNVFKITNFFWLMCSTYWWLTANMSMIPILLLVNVAFIISMSFLPIKIEFGRLVGRLAFILVAITAWYVYIDGPVMGTIIFLMYLPAFYLIQLPPEYLQQLLTFTTKWYAVALGGSLMVYAASFFVSLPSLGTFVNPVYPPFTNHVLYLKTTFDYGWFERFNAFFLEPGHQALLSSFLMMANKYDFKKNPWLYVLGLGVVFSFSLAGYLLTLVGFLLVKVNSIPRLAMLLGAVAGLIVAVQSWDGGNNPVNELILGRLEYDESKGIKGNNRVDRTTDYEFTKMMNRNYYWEGATKRTNMELIAGAGYKIYTLHYGFIGLILAFAFYLSLIPETPDWKYTVSFLVVLMLCFIQRAYPEWYSWLFPYITGIYLAKAEKEGTFGMDDTGDPQYE